MRNADLQSIIDRFLSVAPAIITSARSHTLNRSCMICGVGQGQQHLETCGLWELVAARIDYHRLVERPARPISPAPDPVETMAILERGGDFAPSPELGLTQATTISNERQLT